MTTTISFTTTAPMGGPVLLGDRSALALAGYGVVPVLVTGVLAGPAAGLVTVELTPLVPLVELERRL